MSWKCVGMPGVNTPPQWIFSTIFVLHRNIKRSLHESQKWYFEEANWWFGIKTDQLSYHKCQKGFVLRLKVWINKQIWQDCRTFRVIFLRMFCNPVKFAYWFTPFNVKRNLFDTWGKITDNFWCKIINWLLRNITFTTHQMKAWCFEAKQKLWKKIHCGSVLTPGIPTHFQLIVQL